MAKEVKGAGRRLVGQAWSAEETVHRSPVWQQAYLSAVVMGLLRLLGRPRVEAHAELLPVILRGVTNRLGSPLSPIRWRQRPSPSGHRPAMSLLLELLILH